MKIITENINQAPWHSVTKQDILTVVKNVPAEWIGPAHVFLIAAQKFENSGWDRPVVQNNTTFRILSRGQEKTAIIKELLIEMAINPTQIWPRYGHRLDKAQRSKIEQVTKPYYEKIMAALSSS